MPPMREDNSSSSVADVAASASEVAASATDFAASDAVSAAFHAHVVASAHSNTGAGRVPLCGLNKADDLYPETYSDFGF